MASAAAVALPSASRADAVLMWNDQLLSAIRQTSALLVDGPPEVAREMAMVDTAMYDAVNAATGLKYRPYAYTGPPKPGVSVDAAALAAGYQVLTSIFSNPLWQRPAPQGDSTVAANVLASISTAYNTALSSLNTADPNVAKGLSLGQQAANDMIARRASDGSAAAIINGLTPQVPTGSGTVPGVYVPPSASGGRPEMLPMWGTVRPFGTTIGAIKGYEGQLPVYQQLNSAGLATFIQSAQYAKAVLQTECSGSATPLPSGVTSACGAAGFSPPTAAQTNAALFWNDPGGTVQPPGHWLQIADSVMSSPSQHLSELQEARLSALVSIAETDDGIGAWDIKYQENLWRPITAIRDCANWNSFFTTCDPTWLSEIATPPHPDYIAGHPAFSAAAAMVLKDFFGTDNIAFCSTSDGYVNGAQGPVGQLTECFDSFSDAASGPNGAEFSRVAGGIHTPLAVEDALQLGNLIGADVFANNLQFVPEPATALLLATGFAALPIARRRWRRGVIADGRTEPASRTGARRVCQLVVSE